MAKKHLIQILKEVQELTAELAATRNSRTVRFNSSDPAPGEPVAFRLKEDADLYLYATSVAKRSFRDIRKNHPLTVEAS